ncbi:MAG: YihY/virulence factor BrkB family protein [Thermoleophilaceae bacterium]
MTERAASVWRLLRRAGGSMVATAGTRDAAQVAYYLVMSFPAVLLLLVWAFSAVLNDESVREPIVDAIVQALPLGDPSERQEVEQLLDEVAAGAGSLGWLGAVSLLYSASGAIGAMRHAVNDAWGERDTRPFVQAKALDAGLTLVVAPIAIVALGLTLSGELSSAIGDRPWLAAVAQFSATRLLPLALLFALLAGLFLVLPVSHSATMRTAWPGALAAVVGVVAVEAGTELYFSVFGNANAIYGTMGLLLALIFSAYLVALVVILGAHVSAAAGRPAEEPDGPRAPLGRSIAEALRGLFVRGRRA